MIEKINNDVYKINSDSNVYLILNPEIFLIDTSNNQDSSYIKKQIQKITPLESINNVLLTHLHYDHCGNLDLFENAQVYAPKKEIENFFENPNDFFLFNVSKKTIEKLKKAKPLPNKINDLTIINVPGHTKGSVAFLDEKRKILFSGDTLFENGIGRTDFNNSAPEKMNESLKKLRNLILEKDLKLCSGHG